MTERTNVVISDHDKLVIKTLGFKNFSEFVRLCMDGVLSLDEEICPHCGNLIDKRRSDAIKIGHEIRVERLKQMTIVEPEPQPIREPEKKIRCYDTSVEAYALIPVSEIERHPDWYILDETIAPYEVTNQ